ncbi:hypothetical protein ACJB9C_002205 [Listeria monocytogenes]
MKQLHKNRWLLIGLIIITIFSSLGNSLSVIAETLDSSAEQSTTSSEILDIPDTTQNVEENPKTTTEKQNINEISSQESIDKTVSTASKDNISEEIPSIDVNISGFSWEIGAGVDSVGLRKWVANNFKNYILGSINGQKLGPNVGDKIEGDIVYPKEMKIEGFNTTNWNNGKTIILGGDDGFYRFENIQFSYPDSIRVELKGNDTDTSRRIVIERIEASGQSIISIGVKFSFSSKGKVSGNGIFPKVISPSGEGEEISFNLDANPSQSVAFSDLTSEEQVEIRERMKSVLGARSWKDNIFNGSRDDLPTTLPSLGWEVGDSYFLDINKIFSNVSIDNGQNIGGHITVTNKPDVTYADSAKDFMKHQYVDEQIKFERLKKGFINKSVVYWENVKVESNDLIYRISNGSKVLIRIDEPIILDKVIGYSGARGPENLNVSVNDTVNIGLNEKFDGDFILENILKEATLDDKKISNNSLVVEWSPIDTSTPGLKDVRINFKDNYSNFIGGAWNQLSSETKIVNVMVEDAKLTAEPKNQELILGSKWEDIDPYDLVGNVKFGTQELDKEDYSVEITEKASLDIVGNRKAKVLVTYKKDTSKTLSIDVPVNILWGNSIVYGGDDYGGDGRATAAFTLNNGDSPSITAAQGGTRDDNLAIHSNFANKKYYTFNWFDFSNKQTLLMTEEQKGTSYIQANGNDLKKDKLKEWGVNQKQAVNYGDVVRAWQVETGKNWLYENEQKNFYNKGNQSVYYEITKTGYKPLTFNQATINKRTISIDESDEGIDNKIAESIELPTGVTAKFVEYPNREKQGDAQGLIRVSQKIESGKTIEYDYIVPFEVINDRLIVETKEADIFLGTNIDLISPNTFINSVKLGEKKLNENDYKVEYVTNLDTSIIGKPQVNLKITLKSDESKFINTKSKATIKYGSTIISRAYNKSGVDVSVSLLDKEGTPYLNANQGFGFNNYVGLLSRPNLSIHRNNSSNQILNLYYGTVKNSHEKLAENWNKGFNNIDLKYGDVVKYSVNDYASAGTNSKGKNTWISRNDSLVRETQGYSEAYYELTKDGYRLMNINQLVVNNSNKIPLNTSQEEMNENVMDFISIPAHISNPEDYRMEFESVDTNSSGKKASRIRVYQKLQSGGEFMTTYSVNYTVNPEIEETAYDLEGNKISETKKTEFDYGTQFTPAPDKYIEKEGILYTYNGWLNENEVPGIDAPKEGIPEPTKTEGKLHYIYEKADKYINVTIPTEIVFGTFDNTEEVKSNKYEIKNNSKELTTNVSLESFQGDSASVKLLGENEAPDDTKDSARLNLLINDEPKIKGLNETKRNISLVDIEPENTATMGINGEYYARTSQINIVEYNTKLKFKAVSGK